MTHLYSAEKKEMPRLAACAGGIQQALMIAIAFKATLNASLPIGGAREGQRYEPLRGFSREVSG
ncbi:MAG TPA: hypothetical protein VFE53_17660 [Mucilaginibacter sp.]|nr:hypothetical protein [Mucilaginibacter sp.]